jgi:hypothetical protein
MKFSMHCETEMIRTSNSKGVASIQSRIGLGQITFLLRWNWFWRWGDWRVRELSSGLFTLSSIAIVANTALIGSTPDLDHAILTPRWTPRVLDQPVVYSILSTISNNQDSMVDVLRSTS